jgi:hypothetical protein
MAKDDARDVVGGMVEAKALKVTNISEAIRGDMAARRP